MRHIKKWNEEEDNLLRSMYDRMNVGESVNKLTELTGRSRKSIEHRMQRLGLSRSYNACKTYEVWQDFELSIIHGHAEFIPLPLLTEKINNSRKWHGFKTKRTPSSVKGKLTKLGYKTSFDGDYYNIKSLATNLGCSHQFITNLLKDSDFRKILNPQKFNDCEIVISKENFAKFAKKYPGELTRLKNLDLVWYTEVLTSLWGKKGNEDSRRN